MASDLRLFLGQLIRKPGQVVALAPSSTALAAEMVATLDPARGPVIELGAGTGKITRAILGRAIPPEQVHAIEMNPTFCAQLREEFPGLHVHERSATETGELEVEGAQAVISGLPLLSMPPDTQRAILTGVFEKLGPKGSFIQFTYGPKPPVHPRIREEMKLRWTESPKVWWNLPPAKVYRFRLS